MPLSVDRTRLSNESTSEFECDFLEGPIPDQACWAANFVREQVKVSPVRKQHMVLIRNLSCEAPVTRADCK